MKRRVIAVGLDSVDFDLLQRYIDSGDLPNISRLRKQSGLAHLETQATYADGTIPYAATEGNWVMFQTGVRPATSGYWETITFDPKTYRSTNDFVHGGYNYQEFAPFFALGENYRVATFDIPVSTVAKEVNGYQIVGWGGHFPYVVRGSQPRELLSQVNSKHGRNRILYRDHGVFWSRKYRSWLERTTIKAMQQREKICCDLLQREPWDLFITVLGETHSALHDLWSASDKTHPVHAASQSGSDPLRNVFQAVDQTVGTLAAKAGDDANFILFSVHGIKPNATDLPCLFFLSEIMYRLNFPGQAALAAGDIHAPVPPPVTSGLHWYWFGELWRKRQMGVKWLQPWLEMLPAWMRWNWPGSDLRFPFFMNIKGAENGWMPAMWYRLAWRKMRSFAIPAFADGHIRINLKGRESHGIVPPQEYDAECERITKLLLQIRDARTGLPIVKGVYRTRSGPEDNNPRLPPADLVVQWDDSRPFDVIESAEIGRIGPVPYFRTGGHRAGGFALIRAPEVAADSTLHSANVYDLPATILQMLGAPIPPPMEGKSMLLSLADFRIFERAH